MHTQTCTLRNALALQESSTLVTPQASIVVVMIHLRLNDVSSMNSKIIYVL